MSDIYIGIDLGGTNIKIGVFDEQLDLLHKDSVATQADMGPDVVVERMAGKVTEVLAGNGLKLSNVAGAGIGTPGPANYREGVIINSTNMPTFRNVPIRQMLSDSLGVPVAFDNDANVACFGEFSSGAGKDVNDMVFFTLGTGIGGGIVSNGRLIQGSGGNGAELGHMIIYPEGRPCNCGQKGCVEAYASASWTAKRAAEAIKDGAESTLKKVFDAKGEITCRDVFDHARTGDKLAIGITDETARALAILCVNMLHVTEPQRIVFAGGMIAAGEVLLNRIKEYFDEEIWSLKKETVEICFAQLGEDAGIIGAAALARQMNEN
ncbi:MAG: ROK family protein [Planctomycetota bacterium]